VYILAAPFCFSLIVAAVGGEALLRLAAVALVMITGWHATLHNAGCAADKYGDPNVAATPAGCFVCPVGSSRPGFTTAETFQCGECC
jgi:hypothetical protein